VRRPWWLPICLLWVTPVLAASGPQATEADGPPSLRARSIGDPVDLDGVLDEPAWSEAEAATGFTQREPEQGEPASEPTEVRVLYTDSHLYLGIRAHDSDPSAIVANEMRRDGGGAGRRGTALDDDDSISIVLDTFDDRRNAFFFETKPNGARADALITDEGTDRNFEWDGVWEVAAGRDDGGWTAEVAIPFATLRFDPDLETWGLNVRRRIRRKSEEVFWAAISREADIFRISRAGRLTGLEVGSRGLNLRIKPFVVASGSEGTESELGTVVGDAQGGLDVRWGMTQGLTLDLTYNTDFAQVEVDEQQVNLTRFSLFFPEKREFFLENAGIFDFGTRGSGGFRPPLLKVFFSRRIGIGPGGTAVPILAGGRVTGRVGEWNVGLLDVQTESVDPAEVSTLDEPFPSTNWAVARIKRNVGERSSLGAIVTNRQSEGDGDWNRVWGLDADINPHRKLSLNGFVTGSSSPDSEGDAWAANAGIGWRGPVWRWGFDYIEIRENYDPEVGFLLRRDIRRLSPEVNFEPRPELPWIRNLSFEARSDVVYRTDGTLETMESSLRFLGLRSDAEDFVAISLNPNFERLFEPFEIQDDVVIPPGDYTFHDWSVFFRSNSSRLFSGNGFVVWGDFFDGTRLTQNYTVNFRPSGMLSTSSEWNRNDVDLPNGEFVTNVLRQRVSVSFSPEIFLNGFLQYNDTSELTSLNTRFNWIYRPGADLFVVYNESWDTPSLGDMSTRDRALVVKFTYLLAL